MAQSKLSADVCEVLKLAGPNALGYVSALLNELTNVIFIGHRDNPAALAAVGSGNMMQNCISLSLGFGMASGLDTLISQAYGAGQKSLMIDYLQRCRLLLTLQLIWMIPLLCFTEPILKAIHQNPDVARDAGLYNRASVFGLFALLQFEVYRRFYQNQTYTAGPAAISWVTTFLHPLWCYIFVWKYDLGNLGAGIANVVTWYLQLLLVIVYSCVRAPQLGFTRWEVVGLSGRSLRGWVEFLKVCAPSVLQMCCEWWFWELCAVVVGYIKVDGKTSPTPLAAHVAAINFVALSFMPTIGVSNATAAIVGNYIGAKDALKAKRLVKVAAGMNSILWCGFALCIAVGRQFIAEMYVKKEGEEDVLKIMKDLLLIFCLAGFSDTNQNVLGGALRGLGHQNVAGGVYMLGFYGFMLPLGIVLAFVAGMGVYGIWWSFLAGTGMALLIMAWYIMRLDFDKVVQEAQERIEADSRNTEESHLDVSLTENAS